MKKGQVAIFILVAIAIFALILGISIFLTQKRQQDVNYEYFSSTSVKPEVSALQGSFVDCIKTTSDDALLNIGEQGGYYDKPSSYLDFEVSFLPYYYYQGNIEYPTKTKVESELEKYMDKKLLSCMNKIDNRGFDLIYQTPKTKATIKDKDVDFVIDLPVDITKDKNKMTLELKNYPVNKNSELKAILDVAEFYTNSHKEDPRLFCISCLDKMAEKNDLYVNIVDFTSDSTIVVISENHTSTEPYYFAFVNKYTGEENSPEIPYNGTIPKPIQGAFV